MLLHTMRRPLLVALLLAAGLPALAQIPGLPGAQPVRRAAPPAAPAAARAGAYTVEPAPAWVVPPPAEAASLALEKAPLAYPLIDDQVRIDGRGSDHYAHFVRQVGDAAGLAVAAQLEIEFDPSFQSLAIHHIDVVRGGMRSSRLDRKKVQLLQREANLERRMYDGRITFSLVLDDVRVGDKVDIAYTVRGANPVFGGRYVDNEWMVSAKGPVALYRNRFIAPAAQAIVFTPGAPDMAVSSQVNGAVRETVVTRRNVPAWRPEQGASSQVVLDQQLLASQFDSWQDVAAWGQRLFAEDGGPTPLLDRKAAELAAAGAGPSERLLGALDFVQKEVRYFGTEIGPSTHRPARPEQVLQQRFGDCKDKVALLLALLRRMGIAGEPVLVSSIFRGKVARMAPTPLAFDHVIARVRIDGQAWWLDATRAHQSGPLAARQALTFAQGLALGAEQGLVALPPPAAARRLDVDDRFIVEDFAAPVILESRITLRGELAEGVREGIASGGLEAMRTQFSEAYVRMFPKLASLQPAAIETPAGDNAVVLVQRFAVPEFWRFPERRALVGDLVAWAVIDALRLPRSETRRDPLGIALPGIYAQRISLQFPVDVIDKPSSNEFDDGDANVSIHVRIDGARNGVQMVSEAVLKTDELLPTLWSSYNARLQKNLPRLAITATVPAIPLARMAQLGVEAKVIDEQMRSGRSRPKTRIQAEAQFKVLLLGYVIDGGRLSPPLLAQTLTERGIQRDHLALLELAGNDFARALSLAPEARETLNGAAVNAILRGDYRRAVELADAVVKQSAGDSEALRTRATARYLAGDYAASRADLATLLQDSAAWRSGYPLVMWMLVQRRLGDSTAAPGRPARESELPADWPRALVDWADGKSDSDALLRAARSVPAPAAERLCEAYFYIGERYQADGDAVRAAEYYRKAIDLGISEYMEDGMARLRLAAGGGGQAKR